MNDLIKNATIFYKNGFRRICDVISINEKGVYIAINYGLAWKKKIDFSPSGVPSTFIFQEALETCESTKEVIEFISSFPARSAGAHYGIVDNTGDICILETTKTRTGIRRPSESGLLPPGGH